jgi:hypothetical protein
MGFSLLLFLKELKDDGFIYDDRDIELIAKDLKPLAIEILIKMYDRIKANEKDGHSEL